MNRTSIPEKYKYWKVFEYDLHINIFLELLDEFVNKNIDIENKNSENFQDEEEIADENVEQKDLKNMIGGKEIIQLKGNYIPKGIIPLENCLNQDDVAKYPKLQHNEMIFMIKILELKILLK